MAKPCVQCGIKPKRRKPNGHVVDGFCSAKCKRAAKWDAIKFTDRMRQADPDHGFFQN